MSKLREAREAVDEAEDIQRNTTVNMNLTMASSVTLLTVAVTRLVEILEEKEGIA